MKGVVVALAVRAIRAWQKQHGAGEAAADLPPAARSLLDGTPIVPSSWYAYEDYLALMGFVRARMLDGSPEAVLEFAARGAPIVYGGPHRGLIEAGSPRTTLGRIGPLWRVCHDFGRPRAEAASREAIVRIADALPMSSLEGYINAGWIRGILEVAGAREVRVAILERPWGGNDELALRYEWEH